MNQNANDQLLLLRENTERRVSTLCRAPLRVAFCEAFFIHSRMLDSCWVFVVQSCTPPKQPWKDGRVPELYEPGLRLSLGAGTMHRNFSGQDVWNLVSQVSWAAWGVTSWPRMGFVGMEYPGLVVHHTWMTLWSQASLEQRQWWVWRPGPPSLGRSGKIGICCVRAFRNHLLGPFELFLLILKFRTDRFTWYKRLLQQLVKNGKVGSLTRSADGSAVSDANLSQWTLQASFTVDVRYQIAGQEIGGPVLLTKDQSWLGMQRGHFFEKLIHTHVRWSTVISKLQAVAFEVFDVSMTHTPYCTYYFHLFSPMICHSSWRYKLKFEEISVRIQPSTAQWKQTETESGHSWLAIDSCARLGVQLTLQPCFLPRRAASRDFVATLQVHRVVVVFFLDIGL